MHTVSFLDREIQLTSPALTVVDVARWHGIAEAVALGDRLLRMHVLESDAVHGALAERKYCAQVNQAVVAAGLFDGTSESEVKVALHREHITIP